MKRVNRLRNQLILVFIAATLPPFLLVLYTSVYLLDRSLTYAPARQLDEVSKSLERTGRDLYQRSCELLRSDAAAHRLEPRRLPATDPSIADFAQSRDAERFTLAGRELSFYQRHGDEIWVYAVPMRGVDLDSLHDQYAQARAVVEAVNTRNFRRGFLSTFLLVSLVIWLASLAALVYWAYRISGPIQLLTQGLRAVAGGDLSARVNFDRDDETGAAIAAFNHMASQIEQSRARLIHVTKLASWQALARKMAHEVKNSLTPIRLTMEEIAVRHSMSDSNFMEQASQIVVDEVISLERRVRAFSEFAAEPPVTLEPLNVNAVIEERIALLKTAHLGVEYQTRLMPATALTDRDLLKGVLTNLIENAAQASRSVLVVSAIANSEVHVEVHDNGPGLNNHSRETLFEPTISFKKGGMGLGLSIARKSALLCGADLVLIESELGGAAFRMSMPLAVALDASEDREPVHAKT